MYVVDAADMPAVSAVHGELFGDIRPAATLIVVARLMEPSLLVEVEADAIRAPSDG
jgi:enamine deaminase RidA (YjgF/YER057c/UK114 family)